MKWLLDTTDSAAAFLNNHFTQLSVKDFVFEHQDIARWTQLPRTNPLHSTSHEAVFQANDVWWQLGEMRWLKRFPLAAALPPVNSTAQQNHPANICPGSKCPQVPIVANGISKAAGNIAT